MRADVCVGVHVCALVIGNFVCIHMGGHMHVCVYTFIFHQK
jgi:hypothetical protein